MSHTPATPPSPNRGGKLLRETAYDQLREAILGGAYPPGSFLSEREVADWLKMSKTPIRMAFERLAEQGFVSISPQRGVVVTDLSSHEVADHYDLRIAIETFTVRRLAARGLTDAQRQELEANLAEQDELVAGVVQIAGFTQADACFHLSMSEALGNGEIVRTMRHQRDRVQRVVESIFHRDSSIPVTSVAEHRSILAAIVDGDGEKAARAVETHLENGKRFLLLGGVYGQPV